MPKILLLPLMCALVLMASCRREKPNYDRPLAPGEVSLQELPVAEWPTFTITQSNRPQMVEAIDRSLNYLGKPSAANHFPIAGVDQQSVIDGLQKFRQLVVSGATDSQINSALRRDFRVFRSVGWDRKGTVLFTGYYTPIFEARLQRDSVFRYPIHSRPKDLISGKTGKEIAMQDLGNGRTRPYPTAGELKTSGVLNGTEVAWFADPFDAYIVIVQGSARLRLGDGSIFEVGYAGTNGHEYHAIAYDLINEGQIRKEDLNLKTLREFFRTNPHLADEYINRNPRYVFFQQSDGGPFGSLGEKVTTDISIAADKRIFPRGALTYVTTNAPDPSGRIGPYAAFRLDQDNGGAIAAPGRSDLYMGVGNLAELRAGHQYAEGFLYYLIAK